MSHLNLKENCIISLRVRNPDNTVVLFKFKKDAPLEKLMKAHCDRMNFPRTTVTFKLNGFAVRGDETPKSLNLEENDTLDAFPNEAIGTWSRNCPSPNRYCKRMKL